MPATTMQPITVQNYYDFEQRMTSKYTKIKDAFDVFVSTLQSGENEYFYDFISATNNPAIEIAMLSSAYVADNNFETLSFSNITSNYTGFFSLISAFETAIANGGEYTNSLDAFLLGKGIVVEESMNEIYNYANKTKLMAYNVGCSTAYLMGSFRVSNGVITYTRGTGIYVGSYSTSKKAGIVYNTNNSINTIYYAPVNVVINAVNQLVAPSGVQVRITGCKDDAVSLITETLTLDQLSVTSANKYVYITNVEFISSGSSSSSSDSSSSSGSVNYEDFEIYNVPFVREYASSSSSL